MAYNIRKEQAFNMKNSEPELEQLRQVLSSNSVSRIAQLIRERRQARDLPESGTQLYGTRSQYSNLAASRRSFGPASSVAASQTRI
jgi:hypothetical protein